MLVYKALGSLRCLTPAVAPPFGSASATAIGPITASQKKFKLFDRMLIIRGIALVSFLIISCNSQVIGQDNPCPGKCFDQAVASDQLKLTFNSTFVDGNFNTPIQCNATVSSSSPATGHVCLKSSTNPATFCGAAVTLSQINGMIHFCLFLCFEMEDRRPNGLKRSELYIL